MSPVNRTLAAEALSFDLGTEMQTVAAELASGHARIARTLVKEGALRLTLIGLAADGAMHTHRAPAPITIHVLQGAIVLDVNGSERSMKAGELAAVDADVPHALRAPQGAMVLLTVAGDGTTNAARPGGAH